MPQVAPRVVAVAALQEPSADVAGLQAAPRQPHQGAETVGRRISTQRILKVHDMEWRLPMLLWRPGGNWVRKPNPAARKAKLDACKSNRRCDNQTATISVSTSRIVWFTGFLECHWTLGFQPPPRDATNIPVPQVAPRVVAVAALQEPWADVVGLQGSSSQPRDAKKNMPVPQVLQERRADVSGIPEVHDMKGRPFMEIKSTFRC